MRNYTIKDSSNIIDTLAALNELSDAGLTLFVRDKDNKVIGAVTDGDIRRTLIAGSKLTDSVTIAINENFSYFKASDKDNVLKYKEYKGKLLHIIPVLDDNGRLVDVVDMKAQQAILPIDAVLMAGGKGERLRPLTENTPKPLLPVGDKTIIDHNVDRLISYGINHISVTVNYLKEQLEEHFKEPKGGVKVNCYREPKFLGTIGSIKLIDTFYNDTVLVINSDLFTNIDYEDFYLHFKEHDAKMSVAVVPYTIKVPYGIFDLEGRNIQGFVEKPTYNYYANAGIYLMKKDVLAAIPDDTFFNATDMIEKLIAENKMVIRYPLNGTWIDIGNHQEYAKAQELVKHIISVY